MTVVIAVLSVPRQGVCLARSIRPSFICHYLHCTDYPKDDELLLQP